MRTSTPADYTYFKKITNERVTILRPNLKITT